MTLAAHYAHALWDLAEASPARANRYLKNLREVLARRGHTRLLPQIYAEYERLSQRRARAALYRTPDPARERTRQLMDMYRRLIA